MLIQNSNNYNKGVYINNERCTKIYLGSDLYWEAPKSYATTNEYGAPSFYVSHSPSLAPAIGGYIKSEIYRMPTWGYYDSTTNGGTVTSDYTIIHSCDNLPSGWELDSTTGIVKCSGIDNSSYISTRKSATITSTLVTPSFSWSSSDTVMQYPNGIYVYNNTINVPSGTSTSSKTLVGYVCVGTCDSGYWTATVESDWLSCSTSGSGTLTNVAIRSSKVSDGSIGYIKFTEPDGDYYQYVYVCTKVPSSSEKVIVPAYYTFLVTGTSYKSLTVTLSDGVALSTSNPLTATVEYVDHAFREPQTLPSRYATSISYSSDGSATFKIRGPATVGNEFRITFSCPGYESVVVHGLA